MDALVDYGSGSEESDNGEQKQKQASHEEGDICREIPVSETSPITTMDLPQSSRVPLPLELNCEIFKCLKLPIQRNFIWGLGRDIYGMFGQKLLKKTKRVRNPQRNYWSSINTRAIVAADGLNVNVNNANFPYPNIFAVKPFPTSGPDCRVDDFPGTICYYYEVKADLGIIGLSYGAISDPDEDHSWIGRYPNSYAIPTYNYECWLSGEQHHFELPEGVIRPEKKANGNVYGCGLVLDSEDKMAIFFTLNGNLLGQKIPISPTVDRLFPTVKMMLYVSSFEANFGDDLAKPFEYDIHNCPGLELACI